MDFDKQQHYICQNPGCRRKFPFRKKGGPSDSHKYCSHNCFTQFRQQGLDIYNQNPNICLQCNEKIYCHDSKNISETKLKKFCNRSCSAKYNNSKRVVTTETKNKISMSVKNNLSGFCSPIYKKKRSELNRPSHVKKYSLICSNILCKNSFEHIKKDKKYCSPECWKQCSGGYRQGAGRSKSGYYKNIWCDSTYELAYVIYCLEHNIKIERNKEKFPYFVNGKKHYYVPDFIVNDKLVEIKGWHTELVDIKMASVTKPIKILYKNDLKNIFEYIKNKTGLQIDDIFCLYEDYIPEKKKCEWLECNNEILVIPSKKDRRFCSNTCSAKYRNRLIKNGGTDGT